VDQISSLKNELSKVQASRRRGDPWPRDLQDRVLFLLDESALSAKELSLRLGLKPFTVGNWRNERLPSKQHKTTSRSALPPVPLTKVRTLKVEDPPFFSVSLRFGKFRLDYS